MSANLPKIKLVEPESTYLLWLDFTELGLPRETLERRISENARLWLTEGTVFGPGGAGFFRVNAACPKAVLAEALHRLEKEFAFESGCLT